MEKRIYKNNSDNKYMYNIWNDGDKRNNRETDKRVKEEW